MPGVGDARYISHVNRASPGTPRFPVSRSKTDPLRQRPVPVFPWISATSDGRVLAHGLRPPSSVVATPNHNERDGGTEPSQQHMKGE